MNLAHSLKALFTKAGRQFQQCGQEHLTYRMCREMDADALLDSVIHLLQDPSPWDGTTHIQGGSSCLT